MRLFFAAGPQRCVFVLRHSRNKNCADIFFLMQLCQNRKFVVKFFATNFVKSKWFEKKFTSTIRGSFAAMARCIIESSTTSQYSPEFSRKIHRWGLTLPAHLIVPRTGEVQWLLLEIRIEDTWQGGYEWHLSLSGLKVSKYRIFDRCQVDICHIWRQIIILFHL